MTPPKESSVESAQDGSQVLQSESSRDLFLKLKSMRREAGQWDDADRVVSIDPADQSDVSLQDRSAQEIPVRIRTKSNEQSKANLDAFLGVEAKPTPQEVLAQIRTEDQVYPPVIESLTRTTADQLIDRQGAPVIDGEVTGLNDLGFEDGKKLSDDVNGILDGARTSEELKQKANVLVRSGLLIDDGKGWFKQAPESHRSQIVMDELERARQHLERRSNVAKAKDGVSRAFETLDEVRQVVREREQINQEAATRSVEENDIRSERVKAQVADKEAAAERGRLLGEERKKEAEQSAELAHKSSLEVKSIEEQIKERQNVATKELRRELVELQRDHREVRSRAERRKVNDELLKQIDSDFRHATGEILKQIDALKKTAAKEVKAEYLTADKIGYEQARALREFEVTENPDPHIFVPDASLTPELAAKIAGENSEEVNKLTPPYEVNEYTLGDTIMQRLVYLTGDKNVVVVEDWDKTSGKLKRQSFIHGEKLLIPDYENDDLGRLATRRRKRSGKSRLVLSNKVYAGLGEGVTSDDVKNDKGTSYQEGYASYTNNLVRSGGAKLTSARELASHNYKPKQSKKFKGFIATLQEEWAKAKPKK